MTSEGSPVPAGAGGVDTRWSAFDRWVVEHDDDGEPEPLFQVDLPANAALVAQIHNDLVAALAAAEARATEFHELWTHAESVIGRMDKINGETLDELAAAEQERDTINARHMRQIDANNRMRDERDAAEQRADTAIEQAKAEAWDARQAAIGECAVDLSSALGTQDTSWPRLVEIAGLHAEIVAQGRSAALSSRVPVQPEPDGVVHFAHGGEPVSDYESNKDVDLMAPLRASIEAAKARRESRPVQPEETGQ